MISSALGILMASGLFPIAVTAIFTGMVEFYNLVGLAMIAA